ncbi:MAG: hypothetical protein N2109_07300 [Fimbriimonadales bacterium]|nr:hypothetical protein [Fimbriimonadales bacterium]
MRIVLPVAGLTVLAVLLAALGARQPGYSAVVLRDGSLAVLRGEEGLLSVGLIGWGPNWAWADWEGKVRPEGSSSAVSAALRLATAATLKIEASWRPVGADRLAFEGTLWTDRPTGLTMAGLGLTLVRGRGNAAWTVRVPGGTPLPFGQRTDFGTVREVVLEGGGLAVPLRFDPPVRVGMDGNLRIALATDRLEAGRPVRFRIELAFPEACRLYPDPGAAPARTPEQSGWFPFLPQAAGSGTDELSLSNWLAAPAGSEGRVVARGDRLFAGGRPIRLWGVNVCYSDCAPPKELADRRAAFYARNGVNAVRLHKFADGPGWAGIQEPGSFARFDAEALDRFDYFVAALKKRGIYVKLSPTFGVRLGPDDRAAVPYLEEFGPAPKPGERLATGHGAIFLSRELQDLQIAQMRRLLAHRNPYTGLTYAQDPAVALIELFNEDSALFYGTMDRLQKVPTLRRRAAERFADWLARRYGTKQAWLDAWGREALNRFTAEGFNDESWEAKRIHPAGNPWFYDPTQMAAWTPAVRRRLHDTMLFLYELQNEFYDRYKAELRRAGYSGEVIASNWIAGRGFSHFYNLHSDARIGIVDRHNYMGGSDGSWILDDSMLERPGSGMLSTGLHQVADRPFSLSEWIHVWPNERGVEGPTLHAAYGIGLQGWDASFLFQNGDTGGFAERLGRSQWEATAPQVMGILPIVSRMVHRGDVREAPIVAARNVHVPSLVEGRLGFDDQGDAAGDVKTADSGTVPAESLAVGRSVVRFTPRHQETQPFDPSAHKRDGAVRSVTGQLAWHPRDAETRGWAQIDTEGTQGVVGFAEGLSFLLRDCRIEMRSPYAAVLVTASSPNGKVADDRKLLVAAIARARNAGAKVLGTLLLEPGQGPVLMEPVRARLELRRPGRPTVHVLDALGRRTGRTVPPSGGGFEIDTGRDRSCYYLIEYP